ncbi:MAG TPA: hypothetical protein VGF93_18285 [Solirubrobacteraceae bacterium]|jgi:hypothetical protein
MKERVRFAAWAAFWGDTPRAARQVLAADEIDYLVSDDGVLGGSGGTSTLRYDPQGKSCAAMLLTIPVEVPSSWNLEPTLSEPAATT